MERREGETTTFGKKREWKTPKRRRLYIKLMWKHKVAPLEGEALRSVMQDKGAEEFLKACLFSIENKELLSEIYPKQWVAISGEHVVASSSSSIELERSLPPEYKGPGGKLIFIQYISPTGVPTEGSGGVSRLSIQSPSP